MKIKNKLAVFLTALLVSFSSSAMAFEGFSIGATYSNTDFSTKGNETTVANNTGALEVNSTTKTGSEDVGAIFAEYTFAQGSTIGIEYIPGEAEIGKASRTQTNIAATPANDASGTITAKATISEYTRIYVEPTWMANDRFGVFVKGGAAHLSVQPSYTETADVIQSTYKSEDVWGVMYGFGAKAYFGNAFIKAEYLETEFGTYSHQSTTGNKNKITADVDMEETRVSIGYNF
jgi:hypothetical protein